MASLLSSSSSHFNLQERFQNWTGTNAPTNDGVADLTPMDVVESPYWIEDLPFELICLIFSNLNFTQLARCAQVSRRWNAIANNPLVLKPVIYRDLAFSNKDWEHCFGRHVLAGEEDKNDFDSLPDDIGKILKSPCPVFPGKIVGQTHMLVRIFKDLTLRILGELAREKEFPNNPRGYRDISIDILDQHGNKASNEPYWVLMTKDVIPGSRRKSFTDQEKMVASIDVNCPAKSYSLVDVAKSVIKFSVSIFKSTPPEISQELATEALRVYQVPTTLEAATCMLVWYFKFRERLFGDSPWTYTRCEEQTQDNNGHMYRNCVGGFALGCVRVFSRYYSVHEFDSMGVAGSRKF